MTKSERDGQLSEAARGPLWPGCLMVFMCLAVVVLLPTEHWWGKVLHWAASLWGVVSIWFLWRVWRAKRGGFGD